LLVVSEGSPLFLFLFCLQAKPWSWRFPFEFGPRAERTIVTALCCCKRLEIVWLPPELWFLIFEFFQLKDFGPPLP